MISCCHRLSPSTHFRYDAGTMKKTTKKLTLHRESLRLLTADLLVAGARAADPYTEVFCPSKYTGVCETGNGLA